MITILHWPLAEKAPRAIDAGELLRRRDAFLGANGLLWIDLAAPTEAEEQFVLREFLPIHALSFEDVTRLRREPDSPPHLPKVEEFPDYLFAVLNPLHQRFLQHVGTPSPDGARDKPLTQLSAVITQHILVTHHYEPLTCIDHLHSYLSRHGAQGQRGPDYLFHLVLDSTVDEFVPVLDHIEDTLEDLETAVMQSPRPELYRQLLRLKREIIVLRKSLIAEREVLVRLARGEFELVDERETVYYRNVYDHLVRFTDLMESSRDMASDLMQTYLAAQSNHLNQIMKVLTMISTIVLPMTLIAGVYGMNFDELIPGTKNEWGFFIALGMMLGSGFLSLAFFWWKRWI